MAVVPEAIEAGASEAGASEAAAWRAASAASGRLRQAPAAIARGYGRVSTPSSAAQTVTRLIWAVALALIVLQIAAEATGQKWSFHLPGLSSPKAKLPYLPLYQGQQLSPMPGVLPAPTPGLKLNPGTGGQ